jgi:hypothetical protein
MNIYMKLNVFYCVPTTLSPTFRLHTSVPMALTMPATSWPTWINPASWYTFPFNKALLLLSSSGDTKAQAHTLTNTDVDPRGGSSSWKIGAGVC